MRAIIVGGGIGGLAAGIALEQAGLEVLVLERAPSLERVGAGISLWANALTALEHLGLGEEIARLGLPSAASGAIRTARGETVLKSSARLANRFNPLGVGLHRADLIELLRQKLSATRLQPGREVVRFENTGEGVRAHCADGGLESGNMLVGADGLHSVVRRQLHGNAPPCYAGYSAWRGVVTHSVTPEEAGEYWGCGQRFGILPLAKGEVYWFAVNNQPEGQRSPEGEKAKLERLFVGWAEPIGALLKATPETNILYNDIYDRPVLPSWGQGRVTLLGDAAHPMTPNLGQGGCQALEDAVVLGKVLNHSSDIPQALRRYEALRRARVAPIVRQSRRLGQVAQWSRPTLCAARNALFRALPPGMQERRLEQLFTFEP